ncbi:MAG: iron-containing alcohol dehydrogenase [Gammaproteobacteria bacterium]|nr:iron-containing alcohol dehydrogenase [Gammaproteobacteria bacterium]
MSFAHIAPSIRIFADSHGLERLNRELARLGCRRAVVFCGRSLAQHPCMELVRDGIGDRLAGTFSGVKAHSPVPAVLEGVAGLRDLRADAVVAVGGGSAIVTARAAAIFLAEGDDLSSISTHRDANGRMHSPRLSKPKLPQLVVPTTPNTAAVKAGTAVFNPDDARRYALFDPKTRASAVFVHADLLASAPTELVLAASLDCLSLAIDGLVSRSGDPFSDALLIQSIRLLVRALPQLGEHDTPGIREDLTMAALLCGRGTDHSGAGITTVLGHAIGVNHHVENGRVKAVLLPETMQFNLGNNDKGFANLALALGVDDARAVPAALRSLRSQIGLPGSLGALGIVDDALPAIAERAMLDWFIKDNPRTIEDPVELVELMRNAL